MIKLFYRSKVIIGCHYVLKLTAPSAYSRVLHGGDDALLLKIAPKTKKPNEEASAITALTDSGT